MGGKLAHTYSDLIKLMWSGENKNVSPFELKKVLGKKINRFKGFGQ